METSVKIPDHVTKQWCDQALAYDQMAEYRKLVLTKAIRMGGPFTVETSEGPLRCEDGWLCFDARGYPYPVAADEFELIYEPALVARPRDLHPSVASLVSFFAYEHLPSELQVISRPFGDLAYRLAADDSLSGPELTVALRKLLEAKDCAVRAALKTNGAERS